MQGPADEPPPPKEGPLQADSPGEDDGERTPGGSRHPLDIAISGSGAPDAAMVGRLLLKLSQWNEHEGRWAKCDCAKCKATSPWSCLLSQLRPKVEAAEAQVAQEELRFRELLASRSGAAAQTAAFVFLWLSDALEHPLVNKSAYECCGDLWPWERTELPESVAKFLYGHALPELSPEILPSEGDEENANELLRVYAAQTAALSARALAQLRVCKCLSPRLLNSFSQDSLQVRRDFGWSVPSAAAVRLLASLGPLLEIGAGNGFWASLVCAAGGDVKCFNSADWRDDLNPIPEGEHAQVGTGAARFGEVLPGGPEQIAAHPGRALVLMWPDYLGRGAFGTECLEAFDGDTLVLVGEWQGRTYGSYAPGLGQHGQSFSPQFQAEVESHFAEETVLRLPNWPLFSDCLMVWRRKSLEALMAQAEPVGGVAAGGDFLAAFFAGVVDVECGGGLTSGELDQIAAAGNAED